VATLWEAHGTDTEERECIVAADSDGKNDQILEEGDMADRQDGAMIVQLAQWGSAMGLEEAMNAMWADDFDPEAASADDILVSRLLNWGETIGTLTKNGLLDTDLVLDWLWVAGLWARVGPAARKQRDKHGVPQLYENFEALAAKQGA